MVDPRIVKVAEILVDYSTKVKKGDRVLIVADYESKDLALEVFKLVLQRGAHPRLKASLPGFTYAYFKYASDEEIRYFPDVDYYEIKNTDVYIALRGPENVRELTNIDPGRISERFKVTKPIHDWRVERTRWVLFYYPTNALAQEAGMALEEFEDFVYNACLLDWNRMAEDMRKIKGRLDSTDKVVIESSDTHLEFSVKGRNAVIGDGTHNMPDGEVFTSVVEDSVEGEIYYDIPAVYMGKVVEGIYLKFEEGKVVEARAKENEDFLLKMLDTDEGARRIGEFGIGYNYGITRPVKNILFDEKIGGTIHLAIGQGYKETLSKNDSAIHWDMIKDLRKDGRIYFDGELVMERGKWFI